MAINISDNQYVNAGKPVDAKYLSSLNAPWLSTADVNNSTTGIPLSYRYIGLTVNVMGLEYWYKNGVTNGDLIEKKYDSVIPSNDFVTGATNLGFFSGKTGVQRLDISALSTLTNYLDYTGNYYSLYNYYYRGADSKIHIGTPSDGVPKRGYLKTTLPVKSWIWSEYTLSGNQIGWSLIDGNITEQIGTPQTGQIYYPPAIPYINLFWSGAIANGSKIIINGVFGSLTTGTTITIGGGVYAQKVGKILEFKTIKSKTPDKISVSTDEAFVYVSGATVKGANLGGGANVYSYTTGNTLQFRSIIGSGNTTVVQSGNNVVIFSSGGTGGGGTYDLSSPSAVALCGIPLNYVLTGKTAFQLFETMLVPELFATTISDRSASIGNNAPTYNEIGSTISFTLTGGFNRGVISPSYWTTGTYTTAATERVGLPSTYTFSGPTGAGSVSSSALSVPRSVTNHPVGASQSWGLDVAYACGEQPMSSKNNSYGTKCLASIATASPTIVNGLYPYYYGKLTSGGRPPVTNNLVTGGTKVIAPSTGDITIANFAAGSNDYTWVAIPASSASRQSWYIDVTNKGSINTLPTDKYPDECAITITTGTGYWSNIPYKVYMSKTIGTINVPIQFRTIPI